MQEVRWEVCASSQHRKEAIRRVRAISMSHDPRSSSLRKDSEIKGLRLGGRTADEYVLTSR
jgi:hypothetical protein